MNSLQALYKLYTIQLASMKGFYVFGDSLTSPGDSWANRISDVQRCKDPAMLILARPGMRVNEFEMPRWLVPTLEVDKVLLYMGANDAGSKVPIEDFEAQMQKAQMAAGAMGLPLWNIQIPMLDHFPHYDPTEYQVVQNAYCDRTVIVEPDLRDSPDTLHMGPKGQLIFAAKFLEAIR